MPSHKRKRQSHSGQNRAFPFIEQRARSSMAGHRLKLGEWLKALRRCSRVWLTTERQAQKCGRPTSSACWLMPAGEQIVCQEGLGLVEEALTQIRHTGGRWIEAELHRVRGELLLAKSEPDQQEAELCFHQALALAREQERKALGIARGNQPCSLVAQSGSEASG